MSERIVEGKAVIILGDSKTVFYNPVQTFNRDISVAVIRSFSKSFREEKLSLKSDKKNKKQKLDENENVETTDKFSSEFINKLPWIKTKENCISVLEALAATGLRAIRYALEIPEIDYIIANDVKQLSYDLINENIISNNVQHKVIASKMDASCLMYQLRYPLTNRIDVIDLDPFGTPSHFLDSAVQAINEGGLLCVTCTDMACLCGNHPASVLAKYGSIPIKSRFCHEMALRIVLNSIDTHANRYNRYIEPLLSISVDFYIRLFVRIRTNPTEVKNSTIKRSYLRYCNGCMSFDFQPICKINEKNKYTPSFVDSSGLCEVCGLRLQFGGPLWTKNIHNKDFINTLYEHINSNQSSYKEIKKMTGIMAVINEELDDSPLYYISEDMCSIVRSTTPPISYIRSSLVFCGYKVSSTHAKKNGLKTNAPSKILWEIIKNWILKTQAGNSMEEYNKLLLKFKECSSAYKILKNPPSIDINTNIDLNEAQSFAKLQGITRFLPNPAPHWGPMPRNRVGFVHDNLGRSLLPK